MFAFVVFVFSVLSQEIGWEELSKMTYFVLGWSVGCKTLTQ